MPECLHKNLVVINIPMTKLRCQHCHLQITPEELDSGYCPECFEETGRKHYDFEEIQSGSSSVTEYRCEDCGVVIRAEEK